MALIQRIAGDGEETLEVKVQENQILIRAARAVLVGSLVQGNFPKYADVIPKECNRKVVINAAQFEHRVRQAALLTNEESRGIKLSFSADKVMLSSRAAEKGEAEVTCPVKLEGEPIDIGFNPAFLTDALRVAGVEEINMEMNAPNRPALIRAGTDFIYVLMPVDLG
jgi:DNA polymerase-3 subunit beta